MSTTDIENVADGLPELDDATIAQWERSVMARIRDDDNARRAKRKRSWTIGLSAAAVVLVVALVPGIARFTGSGSAGGSADSVPAVGVVEPGFVDREGVGPDGSGTGTQSGGGSDAGGAAAGAVRETVTTASANLEVADVPEAVAAVAAAAAGVGGYVEYSSTGDGRVLYAPDGGVWSGSDGDLMPVSPGDGVGQITVRVPADRLDDVMDGLGAIGSVTASAVSARDVTDQAVDLRARIDALRTSVERLTALVAQAGSVADLVSAESALTDRQAQVESLEAQLAQLDDQVAMSSLTVTLSPQSEPVSADPAGFGDGLANGWSWLVAAVNGVVLAVGFLLPWLLVAGAAGGIVWGVRRFLRRVRS